MAERIVEVGAGTYDIRGDATSQVTVPTLTASITQASLTVGDVASLTTNVSGGPQTSYLWKADGSAAPGTNNEATYDTSGLSGGEILTCDVADALQGPVPTAGVTVASAATFVPTDIAVATDKVVWLDFTDGSVLWTDSVGGTNATNGDNVLWISDKFGNVNCEVESGTLTFRGDRCEFVSAVQLKLAASGYHFADMDCYFVVDTADIFWDVLGKNDANVALGLCQSGAGTATEVGLGSPTYRKNGADVSPQADRNDLYLAYSTGAKVDGAVLGFDASLDAFTTFRPLSYQAPGSIAMVGDAYQFVLTKRLSAGEQADMETWAGNQ